MNGLSKGGSALVKAGVSSGTLEGAGSVLIGLVSKGMAAAAYAGAELVTAITLPSSTEANLMALGHCGC